MTTKQSSHPPPHYEGEFVYPYVIEVMPEQEMTVDGRKVLLSMGYRLLRRTNRAEVP